MEAFSNKRQPTKALIHYCDDSWQVCIWGGPLLPPIPAPHVKKQKTESSPVTSRFLRDTLPAARAPHFIVNLELTLKHEFLSSKRVRQIKKFAYGDACTVAGMFRGM